MDLRLTSIVQANIDDLVDLKRIAHGFRRELGFVIGAALEAGILEHRVLIARCSGRSVGFLHFRNKLDHTTKIYQICVLPEYQRSRVGSAMLEALTSQARSKQQSCIFLSCPEDLDANKFYSAANFVRTGLSPGKRRQLIEWALELG